jgi:hypothetical protein
MLIKTLYQNANDYVFNQKAFIVEKDTTKPLKIQTIFDWGKYQTEVVFPEYFPQEVKDLILDYVFWENMLVHKYFKAFDLVLYSRYLIKSLYRNTFKSYNLPIQIQRIRITKSIGLMYTLYHSYFNRCHMALYPDSVLVFNIDQGFHMYPWTIDADDIYIDTIIKYVDDERDNVKFVSTGMKFKDILAIVDITNETIRKSTTVYECDIIMLPFVKIVTMINGAEIELCYDCIEYFSNFEKFMLKKVYGQYASLVI